MADLLTYMHSKNEFMDEVSKQLQREGFNMQSIVESTYVKDVTKRIRSVLGKNLVGLYIIGSTSFKDYIESTSDLDLLGVVDAALTKSEKNHLARILDHANFPCPATGLDIVFMTRENVEEIKPEPAYEFWFSTGAEWPKESWETGVNAEMLVLLELCKHKGIKIYGCESSIEFGEIDRGLILESFKQLLQWHRNYILDRYHDPAGQNSVLNACRIFKYLDTNTFYSKTNGGFQFLKDEPNNSTVQSALSIRLKKGFPEIGKEEILDFICRVENKLDRAIASAVR